MRSRNAIPAREIPFWCSLGALIAWAFQPVLAELVAFWRQAAGSFSHGLISLPLSGLLLLRLRRHFPLQASLQLWPGLLLLLATVASIITQFTVFPALQQLAMLAWLIAAGVTIFGPGSWNRVIGALVPLLLALPLWSGLNGILQWLSVQVSTFTLGLLNIHFVVDGIFVSLESGVFEVADGCSGLRYLLVSLTLAWIFAMLYLNQRSSRTLFLLTSVAVALLSNWIRVFVIIFSGHLSEMQSEIVHDHEYFGWYLYGAFLLPLAWFGYWLEKRERLLTTSASNVRVPRSGPLAGDELLNDKIAEGPQQLNESPATFGRGGSSLSALVLLLGCGTSLPIADLYQDWLFGTTATPPYQIAEEVGPWRRVILRDNLVVMPYFDGWEESSDTSYRRGAGEELISLNLRRYGGADAMQRLTAGHQRHFDRRVWTLVSHLAPSPEACSPSCPGILILKHHDRKDLFAAAYVFVYADHAFADPLNARLHHLWHVFRARSTDAYLIQASLPCEPDCRAARARLVTFLGDLQTQWGVQPYP